MDNRYVTVSYRMYSISPEGTREFIEEATAEHPFQFISGYGTTLAAFEEAVVDCAKGENFNVELTAEEAYGEHDADHIIDLSIDIFKVNGKFDSTAIAAGKIIQLQTGDGRIVNASVKEVQEEVVVVDLNHPLAGYGLAFAGIVTENRPATDEEIQGLMNMFNHEGGCGCGCSGCGSHDDCDSEEACGSGCGCNGCH